MVEGLRTGSHFVASTSQKSNAILQIKNSSPRMISIAISLESRSKEDMQTRWQSCHYGSVHLR
jgi:hypothetical protein